MITLFKCFQKTQKVLLPKLIDITKCKKGWSGLYLMFCKPNSSASNNIPILCNIVLSFLTNLYWRYKIEIWEIV